MDYFYYNNWMYFLMNEIRHTHAMLYEQNQVIRSLQEQINGLHQQRQLELGSNVNTQSGGEIETEPFILQNATASDYRGYNRIFYADEYTFNYEIKTNFNSLQQRIELKDKVDEFFNRIFADAFALGSAEDIFSITIKHATFDPPLYVHLSKRNFSNE